MMGKALASGKLQARRFAGVLALLLLAALLLALALKVGAVEISPSALRDALFSGADSTTRRIVLGMRLPRAVCALMAGAALAMAGAALQAITGNQLASPGVLGINAGASLAVVLALCVYPQASRWHYAAAALGGALLACTAAFVLTRLARADLRSTSLALGGAAVAAVLSSVGAALLLYRQRPMEEIRVWVMGSLAGANWQSCAVLLVFFLPGTVLLILLAPDLNLSLLGEEGARALGQRTARVHAVATLGSLLLAAGAVAVAGPIGFVGLITPHLVRLFWKQDYRSVLPASALAGAVLLMAGDIAARIALAPVELPVGALTAIVGAPFFLYLAQREDRR